VAAWTAAGIGAGAAVRWASVWLAAGEELDVSRSKLVRYGPSALCAVLFALFAADHWRSPLTLIVDSLFVAVLVQVIFFDLEHGLILDRVILPAGAAALILSLFRQPWWAGPVAGLAAGAAFLLLGVVASGLARREALGLGDVKLAACIGLMLGPERGAEALVIGFFSAGAAAIALAMWRRSVAGQIALGPYLAAGALIALFPVP
jgi:leader peptidase (prepilin peptidase) / N-methyltransferase